MRKLLAAGFVLAALLVAAGIWFAASWNAAGPAAEPKAAIVPQGASLAGAADALEEAGVLASADRFRLQARLLGGSRPIQAGEYEFPARVSPAQVLEMMQSGKTLQRFVTIPEGMPSVLVHERLMRASALTGTVPIPAEGSVLPDSYSYQRGESRAAVLKRMQDAMDRELARLWAQRKPHSVADTPREAIILASIVEKETAKPSERRMVAGVYSNRVRQGMRLDADPTIIYPITKGRPLGRPIRRSEIRDVNDYNTYAMVGLPKGPIANPGRESIAAVLNPAETKALYFVADGTGGHIFADTLAEHNRNHARWRVIRAEKVRQERAEAAARASGS